MTPGQQVEAREMREKIRILERCRLIAAAKALRRKLRALERGYELI